MDRNDIISQHRVLLSHHNTVILFFTIKVENCRFFIRNDRFLHWAPTKKQFVASRPKLPSLLVQLNALFWCNVSMALNVGMSLMLEFAMFLQVATYTGHIADVAVTAVSLYFIFDLEDLCMQTAFRGHHK